jgi:hypothetical protein
MSTPPGPQDPYGTPGEQNPYGAQPQPPAYGQQPPVYGQPPAYGQQPPSYPQYGQTPGYPTAGYQGGYPATGTEQNNLGVWALVLGIAGLFCISVLGSIPAIILGNKAKRAAAEGRANNGGLGTAGVVLGWLGVVFAIIGIVALVILFSAVDWNWEEFSREYNYEYSWSS